MRPRVQFGEESYTGNNIADKSHHININTSESVIVSEDLPDERDETNRTHALNDWVEEEEEVQDVLEGKKRTYRPKAQTTENFPLRGFFMCPQCGNKLTGSKCKGRHKYYYYYHCDKVRKYRINSELANRLFKEQLNSYKPIVAVKKKLYTAVLLEAYREHTGYVSGEKRKTLEQIAEYEKKLSSARNLLVSEKIDVEDYNLMKNEYGTIIQKLERHFAEVSDDRGASNSL